MIGLVCAVIPSVPVDGQGHETLYGRMAPLTQYMMEQNAEVTLARSAAPPAISRDARVLVMTEHGYKTIANGRNGFTCLVERSWMSPFDSPEFWNPKMRGPICYNPPASRTILLYTLERTKLALAGLSKSQMLARITSVVAKNELPQPEPDSMSYMMSKHGNPGDALGAWYPHLMFHAPKADSAKNGASWGADLPASPVLFDNEHTVVPEPETIFMVPVSRWSDGTAGPALR